VQFEPEELLSARAAAGDSTISIVINVVAKANDLFLEIGLFFITVNLPAL
jgi:hypothetical protein